MFDRSDARYMQLALELARSCKGQTSPNPTVGAVIVKNGRVVGTGSHLKAGEAHAEVHALRTAGQEARGSTAYVTLEPCSHTGKTPPCADALIQAGVKRVIVATPDPNPLVAGRGIKRLQEAGIEVETGLFETEARQLNEDFNKFIVTGIPFVTVKTAMTLDGKIATVTGHSRWVTGEEARREVHQLRHQHDAILVGVDTVIQDNPQLTTRLPQGGKNPIRIILDSRLRVPENTRVIVERESPTWIFTTDHADPNKKSWLEQNGVQVISTGSEPRVDLHRVMQQLGQDQITSVLVEGGAKVNQSFLRERLVDKIIAYIAPKLIGGEGAPSPFGGEGISTMDEAVLLDGITVDQIGRDIRITGYPAPRGKGGY